MARLRDLDLGTARTKPYSWVHKRANGDGVECNVVIQILTARDIDLARARAVEYVRQLRAAHRPSRELAIDLDASIDRELVEEARQYEVLSVALRDPENPSMPWADSGDLRSRLTIDEIAGAWRAYEAFQEEQGPIVRDLSKEQTEAMIDALVKDVDTDPLLLLAYSSRLSFTRTLAFQLVALRTDNALLLSQLNAQNSASETSEIDE